MPSSSGTKLATEPGGAGRNQLVHPSNAHKPYLLHPLPAKQPLLVENAAGMFSTLKTGHRVLDACGVSIIDHGSGAVQTAIVEQMNKVSYTHSMMHTNDAAEALARFLLQDQSLGLTKAYFVGSGSEAMESAMKLATSYHNANGEPGRTHFVSRKQAYHGNTIGAMSISTHLGRKAPYEMAFNRLDVSHVSAAYAYRGQHADETEVQYAARLVRELEAEFLKAGPHRVAAFVAETVGGSTAGCIAPPKTYFEGVRRICSKYGVLLILDEVMCGSGRTGTYFAFEAEGQVQPDLVAIGKGLSGGYLPIAATLVRGRVYDAIESNGGFGSKYVGDIRGRGLFWAVEFVEDTNSKQPLDARFAFANKMRSLAHERGVAILSGTGTADGLVGDHIMLAPPLLITKRELSMLVSIVKLVYVQVETAYDEAKVSRANKAITTTYQPSPTKVSQHR
ncbi:hypothetical protein H633G_11261 [Metarhizium anisopliae BRIP 53284]|nr:hypothetical protein H633G_11261 [Metarhizium anisopliae BRIP 53284]